MTNNLPMIFVVPLAGPDRGENRVCIVCRSGGAPAVAAFISPDADGQVGRSEKTINLMKAIQKLHEKHQLARVDIVIQKQARDGDETVAGVSGTVMKANDTFSEEFKQDLRALSEELRLTVNLSGIPASGLTIMLNPEADNTVLLYRGRQLIQKFENIEFTGGFALDAARLARFGAAVAPAEIESSAMFQELDVAIANLTRD